MPNTSLQRTRAPRSARGRSPLSSQALGRKGDLSLRAVVALVLAQVCSRGLWAIESPAGARLPITRVDRVCGFQISLPRDWWAEQAYPSDPCSLSIGPNSWEERVEASDIVLPDAPVILRVNDSSFERAVASFGMRREKDRWIYRTKSPEEGSEAEELSGAGWRGLRMHMFSGNHGYKQGGNAGAGFATTIILGSSKKSATFGFDADYVDTETVLKIVNSFRFLTQRASRP